MNLTQKREKRRYSAVLTIVWYIRVLYNKLPVNQDTLVTRIGIPS
jgi:hypothetical protein